MAKLLWGYNIKSRGTEGNSNTWYIDNLDTGERILIDHIELKTSVSTVEKQIEGKGFGMICEGSIEYREHPTVGKYIVIVPEV